MIKSIDDTGIVDKSFLPFHVISAMIHFYHDNEEALGIQTSIITSIPKEANKIFHSCFPKGLKTYYNIFISPMSKFLFVHNMKDRLILEYSSPFFGINIRIYDIYISRIYTIFMIIIILQCTYQG